MLTHIDETMNTIKRIDEQLMHLFTYSFFYPDLEDRPHIKLAILATLISLEITVVAVILRHNFLLGLSLPLWVMALYEWRLWYRLRK